MDLAVGHGHREAEAALIKGKADVEAKDLEARAKVQRGRRVNGGGGRSGGEAAGWKHAAWRAACSPSGMRGAAKVAGRRK